MRLTITYSKIKKRNLVLINNVTHQKETLGMTQLTTLTRSQNLNLKNLLYKKRILSLNVMNYRTPHFDSTYACVKGHLEPTHLKFSPLFTFSTKSLGQDSPSVHLFSKTIGSRFTTAKIKLGEDSPS